jgi:hypothetical protein
MVAVNEPTVRSARHHDAPPSDSPADFIAAYDRMFHALQRDFLGLSTRSSQIIAEHSGHVIQLDEPQLVVAAMREIVEMAQTSATNQPGYYA